MSGSLTTARPTVLTCAFAADGGRPTCPERSRRTADDFAVDCGPWTVLPRTLLRWTADRGRFCGGRFCGGLWTVDRGRFCGGRFCGGLWTVDRGRFCRGRFCGGLWTVDRGRSCRGRSCGRLWTVDRGRFCGGWEGEGLNTEGNQNPSPWFGGKLACASGSTPAPRLIRMGHPKSEGAARRSFKRLQGGLPTYRVTAGDLRAHKRVAFSPYGNMPRSL